MALQKFIFLNYFGCFQSPSGACKYIFICLFIITIHMWCPTGIVTLKTEHQTIKKFKKRYWPCINVSLHLEAH